MIGIITALEKEYMAMNVMLDEAKDYTVSGDGAGRRYVVGTMPAASGGRHTVYVALSLDMGNNASAIRTSQMLQHFPAMKHVLMVAIAGGVPNPARAEDHVRLGDVVISDRGGVVQYDLGKEEYDYAASKPKFTPRFAPRPPSAELLEAVHLMRAGELRGERAWLKYLKRAKVLPNSTRPDEKTDMLYDSLDPSKSIDHPHDPQRVPGQPRVFMGVIGSADRLLRNPVLRDELRQQHGVKAIEMEGSGVADAAYQLDRGFLVVRGICDYCDSHKNDVWQEYAAAVAAAYTRGLLTSMPAEAETMTTDSERAAKTVFDMRGQTVRKQINVGGDYYEIHGNPTIVQRPQLSDDTKRALADIRRQLQPDDQREIKELTAAVRDLSESNAAALGEMQQMVNGIRRALINLQRRELPELKAELRQSINEVTEVLKANADVGTGLELTIPLIPLLLDYKLNLDMGSGLDLRQWWENLQERLQRG